MSGSERAGERANGDGSDDRVTEGASGHKSEPHCERAQK